MPTNALKKCLPIFLLFFALPLPAQQKAMPGSVVTPRGDTLTGFLHYQRSVKTPATVTFRTAGGTTQVFGPADIRAFRTEEVRFVSGVVRTNVPPYRLYRSQVKYPDALGVDTSFLEVLVEGEISLLYRQGAQGGDNFYLRRAGQAPELLIYSKLLVDQQGKEGAVKETIFTGQLTRGLEDCPGLRPDIERVRYDHKQLRDLLLRYHDCRGAAVGYVKEKVLSLTFHLGVVGGPVFSTVDIGSGQFLEFNEPAFNTAVNYSMGLFAEAVLPTASRRWSIYNELAFNHFRVEGAHEGPTSNGTFAIVDAELSLQYLRLQNLLRYRLPLGEAAVFVNAGLTNGFLIGEAVNYKRREVVGSATEGKVLDRLENHELGYLAGLGLFYRRFFLDLRLAKGTGMSPYTDVRSNTTRYGILVGYRL